MKKNIGPVVALDCIMVSINIGESCDRGDDGQYLRRGVYAGSKWKEHEINLADHIIIEGFNLSSSSILA